MDTITQTLIIYADMVGGIRVKAIACAAAAREGFATATDLADYLVRKGVPFRGRHECVARAVKAAEVKRVLIWLICRSRRVAGVFAGDQRRRFCRTDTLEGSVAARNTSAARHPSACVLKSRARQSTAGQSVGGGLPRPL